MPTEENKQIEFMNVAIEAAMEGYSLGEVPVGALIVKDNQIISKAFNKTKTLQDPSAHAEILAIREACKILGNWRLSECELYVTLELCPMCIGAARLSRIEKIIYGSRDSRYGYSKFASSLATSNEFGQAPEIISGIEEMKCKELLTSFFQKRRTEKRQTDIG